MLTSPLSPNLRKALEQEAERRGLSRALETRVPWRDTARIQQLRPDGWDIWPLVGGRGSGKTRAAAEDTLEVARAGKARRIHVVAPTASDVKKVCFGGESGIIECAKRGEIVRYNKTDLEIEFKNGVIIQGFSAEEPDRLNGPQCSHLWVDEFWACSVEALEQAELGWRIGENLTGTFSSTPKNTPGTQWVFKMAVDAGVVPIRMRQEDNIANLHPKYVERLRLKYAGTRQGQTELEGILTEDFEGALWTWKLIEDGRITRDECPDLAIFALGIDPAITDPELKKNPYKEPDACGIILGGMDEKRHVYVLRDGSEVLSPRQWAYKLCGWAQAAKVNAIVAEGNQGGEMIRETIRACGHSYAQQCARMVLIVHVRHGKRIRAEPVKALYEQGMVHHVGNLPTLEGEMTTWDSRNPGAKSPNGIDALVQMFYGVGALVPELTVTSGHPKGLPKQTRFFKDGKLDTRNKAAAYDGKV